jgi:hypothetical protein
MLVIGLLLAGAVAWLLERISQVPKDPHRRGDLLKRAQVLAVAAVVAAVGLGITLAKTPVVGQAIEQGATQAAGFLSGVYDPSDPGSWSTPAKPAPKPDQNTKRTEPPHQLGP